MKSKTLVGDAETGGDTFKYSVRHGYYLNKNIQMK
jgi:hypothetical protein